MVLFKKQEMIIQFKFIKVLNITFLLFLLCLLCSVVHAKRVNYEFDISTKIVNFTGTKVKTIAIQNQIPAPTIEATVGDILTVTFHNHLDEDTSIHWHGVLLPNAQDGVPYLTTPPIKAHGSFTYTFRIKHAGTYWYHSHTGLQEQRGIYGALVFHPKYGQRLKADYDRVIVLSDWTNENPDKVIANLKKDGDWYALKKNSVQSWVGVIKNGWQAIKNRLAGALTRMGPMDLSDVGYDAFLANGREVLQLPVKSSRTVRLRIINSAAASYFNVEFAGAPMTIVAADGVDVKPIKVKRLRIAIAETYDVIVRIPNHKSYELRSSAEDGTGFSSVFIGQGPKVYAPTIPRPNLFLTSHEMHGQMNMMDMNASTKHKRHKKEHKSPHHVKRPKHKAHHKKDEDVISYMTDYSALSALQDTSFSHHAPKNEVLLRLTGNMERYVWNFNNKSLLDSHKILIKKGQVVRFILKNETMMHHPIHLHGHFFRVLNGRGKRAPLKHTVNVPSMQTVVIEFAANESKDWFFHCHNLYHMKAGMARVVSYEKTTTATRKTFNKLSKDTWYFLKDISALSNMTMGELRASNSKNAFEVEFDYNYKKEFDIDIMYKRTFTRFFDVYVGSNIERESGARKTDTTFIVGFQYILPLLIKSDVRYDSDKHFRFGVGSELQLTKRAKFEWMYNTDNEFRFVLSIEITKNILLSTAYDSDFKWGAGARFIF